MKNGLNGLNEKWVKLNGLNEKWIKGAKLNGLLNGLAKGKKSMLGLLYLLTVCWLNVVFRFYLALDFIWLYKDLMWLWLLVVFWYFFNQGARG